MIEDAKAYAKALDAKSGALFKAMPDTLRAYRGLMDAVVKPGALESKTKELMAVAIAIATHCEGCIVFHVRAAIRHGATREELVEAIGVAIEMGGGPATVYGNDALSVFDELSAG